MDKLKLIDKLREKTNISYEEAKAALENNNWDILDAILYLEEAGKVEKPSVNIFYTNETRNSSEIQTITQGNEYNYKNSNGFQGVFDAICKFIDTCNNIFLQIKKDNQIVLRIPLTVAAILIIFMFWIVIPTALISLFMDIEFYIHSNNVNINMIEVNKVLSKASEYARNIKEKIIRVIKHD